MYFQRRLFPCFFLLLSLVCLTKQAHAQCDPRRDSLALVALFDATNGANWTVKTNWKVVGQPISTWYGITTDTGGCVTCIDMDGLSNCTGSGGIGNNLAGTLPIELNNLLNLTRLHLSGNKLTGSIPNLNLPNLQYFLLDFNQLTSTLPSFSLPKLNYLNFSDNQMTGAIPNFTLPNLQNLILANNKLSGNLPNFDLPNLQTLEWNNPKF